ncbi:uncharacterized protein [Centroberyx affinis]|uniref:uncharacterized protein isoform X2 n=1 Tax=Centroberyx affinis TaxID=166261 RepID=UPI003A5C091A
MMKLLLSSLLLASLSAPSSWSVSSENKFVVTQSPDVTIKEGETVRIDCCWDVNIIKGTVNWLKNQTTVSNETTGFKTITINNGQCQGSLKKKKCNCLNLTFSNIMRNESGRYICKVIVEIPQYYQAQGNGTVITVTARHNTANQPTNQPTKGSRERCSPTADLLSTTTRDDSSCPNETSDFQVLVVRVTVVVVVVVLLAVSLLLLYKWKTKRESDGSNTRGNSDTGNLESVTYENCAPASRSEPDSTYQSLSPATMDQDQTYSTLTQTRWSRVGGSVDFCLFPVQPREEMKVKRKEV